MLRRCRSVIISKNSSYSRARAVPSCRLTLVCHTHSPPVRPRLIRLSSTSAQVDSAQDGKESHGGSWKQAHHAKWWHLWNYPRLRQILRGLRIAFLATVLYNVGVADGLQRYALDPEQQRRKLIRDAMENAGAVDKETGRLKLCHKNSPEVQAVRRVFPRILKAALEETRSQERKTAEELKKAKAGDSALQSLSSDDLDTKLERLKAAKKQLKNWNPEGFVVMDVPTANAFVTAMVPRHLFVHRGLFSTGNAVPLQDVASLVPGRKLAVHFKKETPYSFIDTKGGNRREVTFPKNFPCRCELVRMSGQQCEVEINWDATEKLRTMVAPDMLYNEWQYQVVETDEHLAMLLGHELAHVVHGHGVESLEWKATAIAFQMIMLAILDPTGIFSLFVEAVMGSALKYGVTLPFSRSHELEADATGLRITARALYDPRETAIFFERMLELEELQGAPETASWKSTHPKHEDRIKALHEQEATAMQYYERKLKQEADKRKELDDSRFASMAPMRRMQQNMRRR